MRWNSLKNKIQYTALHNPPPRAVIVHLGSNDIELVKSHELERDMRQDLAFLHSTFPRSRIIVSAALPRLVWSRSDTPINLIERKRTHLNRCIRRFVINKIGGFLSPTITLFTRKTNRICTYPTVCICPTQRQICSQLTPTVIGNTLDNFQFHKEFWDEQWFGGGKFLGDVLHTKHIVLAV